MLMQGQDGVDLEINLNGGKSRYEDDDLDNMVFLPSFFSLLTSVLLGNRVIVLLTSSTIHMVLPSTRCS